MQPSVAEPRTKLPKVAVQILRGRASRASREMVGGEMLIGSGADCDVQMRSPDVAERHCLIARVGRQVTVRRLHHEFPVLLNGDSVAGARLGNGDRLRIGPFEMKVVVTADDADRPFESESTEADSDAAAALDEDDSPPRPGGREESGAGVERRLRIVAEQLDRIERQRGELDRLRGKIEQRQAALERAEKDHALRDEELRRGESDLQGRRESILEAESRLQKKRSEVDDLAASAEKKQLQIDRDKDKLIRVRGRVASLFGQRRSRLLTARQAVEAQSLELRAAFERLEIERENWRQLGEENERTQESLKNGLAELAARFDRLERERLQLDADRQQLDDDVHRLRQRETNVRLAEADLGQRQAEQANRESEFASAQSRLAQDAERLRAETSNLERRANELEADARRVAAARHEVERRMSEADVIERQLERKRDELEASIADFERLSKARKIELELAEQSNRTERELLARRATEVGEREQMLESNAELQRAEQERLAGLAATIARETLAVEQKSLELDEHARRIASTCENERKTLADWRMELDTEVRLRAQERDSFETHRRRWVAKFCRVRESACEMSQRRAILAARERRLVADGRKQAHRDVLLKEKEKELLEQCGQLVHERSELDVQRAELMRKAAGLAAESTRLDALSRDLESRHARLFERERIWRDEVLRKRQELQAAADRLAKSRQILDRQAELHARHMEKIRRVGLETLEKRQQAKADVERILARQEQFRERLDAARNKQRMVLAEVLAQIEMAARRDAEATAWLERIQRENDALVQLQSGFAQAIEQMIERIPGGTSGEAVVPVELAPREVEAWRMAIGACLDRLERFAATLTERERHLQEVRARENDARNQLQALLDSAAEAETLDADSLATTPDGAVEEVAHAVGAVDMGSHSTLDTSEPAEAFPEIAGIAIRTRLHRGAVATVYRAELTGLDTSVALRLFAPQWCRDPKLRAVYESGIRSLTRFRHPNIAGLLGFFGNDERYGAASEWIEGSAFSSLRAGAMEVDSVCHWMVQALSALAAAHDAGFVHRCLTPTKILVDRGNAVRIIGWGEPSWLVNLRRCEQPKSLRAFVAPETTNGGAGDAHADLYSLGKVFLPLIAAAQAKSATLSAPSLKLAALHDCAVIMSAARPGDRYPTAAAALDALQGVASAKSDLGTMQANAA